MWLHVGPPHFYSLFVIARYGSRCSMLYNVRRWTIKANSINSIHILYNSTLVSFLHSHVCLSAMFTFWWETSLNGWYHLWGMIIICVYTQIDLRGGERWVHDYTDQLAFFFFTDNRHETKTSRTQLVSNMCICYWRLLTILLPRWKHYRQ